MSKLNSNKIAKKYALDNGEVAGTFDFEITVRDFECGFAEGVKSEKELRLNSGSSNRKTETQVEELKKRLEQATKLLEQTFRLPQNKRWNILYPAGEEIRNNISKFLNQ